MLTLSAALAFIRRKLVQLLEWMAPSQPLALPLQPDSQPLAAALQPDRAFPKQVLKLQKRLAQGVIAEMEEELSRQGERYSESASARLELLVARC